MKTDRRAVRLIHCDDLTGIFCNIFIIGLSNTSAGAVGGLTSGASLMPRYQPGVPGGGMLLVAGLEAVFFMVMTCAVCLPSSKRRFASSFDLACPI